MYVLNLFLLMTTWVGKCRHLKLSLHIDCVFCHVKCCITYQKLGYVEVVLYSHFQLWWSVVSNVWHMSGNDTCYDSGLGHGCWMSNHEWITSCHCYCLCVKTVVCIYWEINMFLEKIIQRYNSMCNCIFVVGGCM